MNKIEKNRDIMFQILAILCIDILIFQDFLENYVKIFKYFDEILTIIGVVFIIINIIKNNFIIKKDDLIILLGIIIINIIGIFSLYYYKLQDFRYGIIDIIAIIKFFSTYFLSKIFTEKKIFNRKLLDKNIKIIIILFFIFSIFNYIFNLYPGEIRYGIKSNRIFYKHPTVLAAISISLMANHIKLSKKIFSIYNILAILVLISTLRSKAIGGLFMCILITIYAIKTNNKITIIKLGIIGLLIIFITSQQIEYYYLNNSESPRNRLTEESINIAKDYFPIGTGFGTYGSYVSGENYSNVYYKYNLSNVWGISKEYHPFISDTFWPMIIGQFGILGLIIYIICLLIIFRNIQEDYKKNNNKYEYISKLICFTYLLIASSSEAAFVNSSYTVLLAIMIGAKSKYYN